MIKLAVSGLQCNHFTNPLGYQLDGNARLSWIVECDKNAESTTCIEVSTDSAFSEIVYSDDSGERIDSLCYILPIELQPRTRYYWRVTVETQGVTACETAWFETSKLDEKWTAKWISPEKQPERHPVIFSYFDIDKPIRTARAYICGLGLYRLKFNQQLAGDEALSPGLCAYDKWLPYQTYDITELLKSGENTVEVELGNGWYKGRYGLSRSKNFRYGDEFACICEIHVTAEDGSEYRIATDTDWKAKLSCVIDSNIFDGEYRDDTLSPGEAFGVKKAEVSMELLEPRRSPPITVMHRIKPIEVIHTPANEIVLDMGQNMVGWFEFVCNAPTGAEVHLQFGEVMQGGNFYRDNLRAALAEYKYVSDGTGKKVCQRFTFYGFRYVKLTRWHGDLNAQDFTGLVLYSDLQQTGYIKTANEKVNKLFENTLWGQRGNFLDVPTDCPQRDERMGWTGDAQVFFGTAAFNMDVAGFFSKFCYDLWREQEALGGTVPVVIPKHDVTQTGACAWGDAATIIPWNHYIRYGDVGILERQYPSMKAWVEYIYSHDLKTGATRLWRGDFHYCDWLALDGEDTIGNRFGGTERTYLASCFYRYSSMLVAKAAKVLGFDEDAEHYESLSESVRKAIVEEYVTKSGRLAVTTQTAYILALYMDIIPEHWREKTAYALSLKLKESDFHLRTGFIGTPYLCRVLSESGYGNISYRLLLQEDFPSWLYEVNMGATTIWERWNSILPDGSISDTGMNSLNHYAYGSIMEWLYRDAAGINPIEEFPGFRKFRLSPRPDPLLPCIEAVYHSPVGTIKSAWKYLENGELEFDFTVPYGSTAQLTLPGHPDGIIDEVLTPGVYNYRYKPRDVSCFNIDTPISEICKHPKAVDVLLEELPNIAGNNFTMFKEMAGSRSLRDFCIEGFFELPDEQANKLFMKMEKAAGL